VRDDINDTTSWMMSFGERWSRPRFRRQRSPSAWPRLRTGTWRRYICPVVLRPMSYFGRHGPRHFGNVSSGPNIHLFWGSCRTSGSQQDNEVFRHASRLPLRTSRRRNTRTVAWRCDELYHPVRWTDDCCDRRTVGDCIFVAETVCGDTARQRHLFCEQLYMTSLYCILILLLICWYTFLLIFTYLLFTPILLLTYSLLILLYFLLMIYLHLYMGNSVVFHVLERGWESMLSCSHRQM